jgi:pimeloyl-ACP methyl ester carboxylesterase
VVHRRLAHETLVVWGEHDRIFPVDLARRLVAHLGGRARLAVLPEAAHAPNLEHPTPFNRHVLDFLGS